MVFYIVTKEFSQKNSQILKVGFLRQIATFVLISLSNQRIFTLLVIFGFPNRSLRSRISDVYQKRVDDNFFFERRRHQRATAQPQISPACNNDLSKSIFQQDCERSQSFQRTLKVINCLLSAICIDFKVRRLQSQGLNQQQSLKLA